jgi:cytochrome c oxidase subunit 2
MRLRRGIGAAGLALLLGGCLHYQHYQSTFGNAALEGRDFNQLFVIFLVVCSIMYAAVIAFMFAGIARRRRSGEANVVEQRRHHDSSPVMRTGLIGWGAVIGIGLISLAIASFFGDRSMAQAATNEKLSVTVTGNQWWWDITYNSADASKTLRTANELHLPVGVPVRIILQSNDVIHSFWVPSLTGKQDLIPGRQSDVTILPTEIGVYRGQCAEFCGTQHAHMAFVVDVESYPDFLKWWHHQLEPAPAPTTPLVQAGYQYVTGRQCAMCHNVSGTTASGQVGPDLTHLASRRTIAAGTLPMSKGNLYGWVEDPQSIKPGNHMPTIGLEPNDLHAVIAYLETLK